MKKLSLTALLGVVAGLAVIAPQAALAAHEPT